MGTLANVDPNLHDAATIDGASRFQRIWFVNLPSIVPLSVTMFIMTLRNASRAFPALAGVSAKRLAASFIAMAPETLSRALRQMEEEGYIRVRGAQIEIPSCPRLMPRTLGQVKTYPTEATKASLISTYGVSRRGFHQRLTHTR